MNQHALNQIEFMINLRNSHSLEQMKNGRDNMDKYKASEAGGELKQALMEIKKVQARIITETRIDQ